MAKNNRLSQKQIERIKDLRNAGYPTALLMDMFKVANSTISYWSNPEYRAKHKEQHRLRRIEEKVGKKTNNKKTMLKLKSNQQVFNIKVISKFMNAGQKKDFLEKYAQSKYNKRGMYCTPEEVEMFNAKKYTMEQWQKFWKLKSKESVVRKLGQLYLNSCGVPCRIGSHKKKKIKVEELAPTPKSSLLIN